MVLRSLEQKIESLFEGVFGRAFRTNVQPVELARKLSKEMDDHRVVSVSRVYVPNEYAIYLSPQDRQQFDGYENSLLAELEEYLAEHARRESYALLTPPRVSLETDEDLAMGEFGISTRMVQPRHGQRGDEPDGQAEAGATMIYKAAPVPEQEPDEPDDPDADRDVAVLSWAGRRLRVDKRVVVLGRSRECDVQIEDANVSRRHAELRLEGGSHWIVDLDSTNGVEVDGRRVKRAKLEPGDSFTVGSTEVTFSTEHE
jgi:FhaA, N-terminal domain/FHA domain